MKITVLGSGDTRGLPKLGCLCRTCEDAKKKRFERKRFGLIVEEGNTRVLVDAPPDLRSQLLDLNLSPSDFDAVLLTHEHFDHVAGLGEFFYPGKTLPVYGLASALDHVFSEHCYAYLLEFKAFALNQTTFFEPFSIGSFKILPLEVEHSIETQGFLLNDRVAILTDCRPHVPEKTKQVIQGVDLLITDGWLESIEQFRAAVRSFHAELSEQAFEEKFQTKKLNHLLIPHAQALAKEVSAKKTVVLHVAHATLPHEELVEKYGLPGFEIGFDGMVINV